MVIQGDPLSPTIFLMCFNPVLEYLTNNRISLDANGET